MSRSRRASLRELLAENRRLDPEHDGHLSNHLSMALTALAELGATDETLTAFADQHTQALRPLRPEQPLAVSDVRSAVGQGPALVGLIRLLERDLATRGRSAVLADVLPLALPGLSGALFHGLIRTAYALSAEDDAELAHALAYFVTVAVPLAPLPAARTPSAGPVELVARAKADPKLEKGLFDGGITRALATNGAQPGLDVLLGALRVDTTTLDALATVALELYLQSLDFTALHAVTATHALRLVLPHVPDQDLALRYHFQALLAAALTVGSDRVQLGPPKATPAWSVLEAAARDSDDEHDVKLVFTCREEAAVRSSLPYARAAALRLRLG